MVVPSRPEVERIIAGIKVEPGIDELPPHGIRKRRWHIPKGLELCLHPALLSGNCDVPVVDAVDSPLGDQKIKFSKQVEVVSRWLVGVSNSADIAENGGL